MKMECKLLSYFLLGSVLLLCNNAAVVDAAIGEYFEESGFFQSISTLSETPIYKKRSKYQDIEIYESKFYGKILVLDGVLQLTDREADAYNEMMAHMAMFQHSNPKRVLIIGGGDGAVLNEVLKHDSVEHVDHVDLDGDVVKACEEYFSWGHAWKDPRVKLRIGDGAAFVRRAESSFYDVIIQDSSDPWAYDEEGEMVILPSSVLYDIKHMKEIERILKPKGIFNMQAETFILPSDIEGIVNWRQQLLESGFQQVRYGSLYISSYPTGQIGFLLCEKSQENSPDSTSSFKRIQERYETMVVDGKETSYYHPRLQQSSFDIPLWVHKRIYGPNYPLLPLCVEAEQSADQTIE